MAVYALGDLHGRYDLLKQVIDFIKPQDTVIFVGDAADRGPEGWKCIKEIVSNPHFIYLMGNHEHMLMKAMCQYHGEKPTFYANPIDSCIYNGGEPTFKAWIDEGAKINWAEIINNLALRRVYTNKDGKTVCVCHAGFTPSIFPTEPTSIKNLIWNRDHIKDEWPSTESLQDTVIVHGHTPTMLVDKSTTDMITYCDGHKINIDCGAFWTGKLCMLDLDTFEPHYFIGEAKEE